MTCTKRIERRKTRETIGNILFFTFIAIVIFFVAWLTIGIHEVETYSFHAEITDKAVSDEYRRPTEYLIFWCDGEEAGRDKVGVSAYARYRIGDLIEIEATVKRGWFGTEFIAYNVIEN